MESSFASSFVQFCIQNFKFNPKTFEEYTNTLASSSSIYQGLNDLEFPNESISNLFNYECLSLLLKSGHTFRDAYSDLTKNILIAIYNFYSGNKEMINYFDILSYSVPFKNDEHIQKYLNKWEDYNSFVLFNFLLVNYYGIPDNLFDSNSLYFLDLLLLYDYSFIRDNVKNIKTRDVICSIIQVLMENFVKLSGDNEITLGLKEFFFEKGKIDKRTFLIPKNTSEVGYVEFNKLILCMKNVAKDESDIQVIINDLNELQRIKMDLEENNKETENSSDSNNNEDLKDNKNVEFVTKKFEELLSNMKKENDEKFFLLNNEIQSLKKSYNEQKDIIQTQQIDIQSLNNTILNKNITIEMKEKKIDELKQDLSANKKDLKQKGTSLNEYLIKIDNLSKNDLNKARQISNLNKKISEITKYIEIKDQEIRVLNNKVKNLETKMDLVSSRDFLRKVFNDFCYLFHFSQFGNYKEASKIIIEKIKKENDNSPIKKFANKVNLIKFIEYLGKIIEDSYNLSHLFFKELSIQYRNQDISSITTEEIIKENIIKCKNAFNNYSNINFDSIFSFLINECNYPSYIFNKLNISDYGLINAMQNYNNKQN